MATYEVRDQNGMSDTDHMNARAQEAKASAKSANEKVKSLELQIEELRQFALAIMMTMMMNSNLPQETGDYWWAKFASYEKVSE